MKKFITLLAIGLFALTMTQPARAEGHGLGTLLGIGVGFLANEATDKPVLGIISGVVMKIIVDNHRRRGDHHIRYGQGGNYGGGHGNHGGQHAHRGRYHGECGQWLGNPRAYSQCEEGVEARRAQIQYDLERRAYEEGLRGSTYTQPSPAVYHQPQVRHQPAPVVGKGILRLQDGSCLVPTGTQGGQTVYARTNCPVGQVGHTGMRIRYR